MNTSNCNIWQHAAGDTNRNYVDLCLKWDVILNGPGYAGPLPECKSRLLKDGWTSKKITGLIRFSHKIKDGDIVVLRLGTNQVYGVGYVIGDYEWLSIFSDVDGWDLNHVRRVRWIWKEYVNPKRFKAHTMKFGDTTQKLTSQEVIDWIDTIPETEELLTRPLIELPLPEEKVINFDLISEYLFEQGVSSNSIETLLKEIDELIRIARWYQKSTAPSESETVAYLVVPLLRTLGWTPQKMAVEWNNVDVALFNKLPRKDENLSIVVEAKKKGDSCLSAKSQAESYAKGKRKCQRLIVTDGLRYGIYIKKDNHFMLHAYFNLTDLKDSYPIYNCKGITEALQVMTPEWSET